MLKVRLMGTKKDIQWFGRVLNESKKIEINEFSEIYSNKGTNNYYRAYLEINERREEQK